MEYEKPARTYTNGETYSFLDFKFRIEYITDGGARIKRIDEVGHVSFWVPYYIMNRMEIIPK